MESMGNRLSLFLRIRVQRTRIGAVPPTETVVTAGLSQRSMYPLLEEITGMPTSVFAWASLTVAGLDAATHLVTASFATTGNYLSSGSGTALR